jgi:hypothetical protein
MWEGEVVFFLSSSFSFTHKGRTKGLTFSSFKSAIHFYQNNKGKIVCYCFGVSAF